MGVLHERSPTPGSSAVAIPEEFGGGGAGITEASIVLEEIAASGAAMNGCSAIHLSVFGMNPVVKHGSDWMKATYLPRVATGELHVSFGVTEPDAGTDTTNISTRATKVDGGYRVRGPQDLEHQGPHRREVPAPRPHDAARRRRRSAPTG